MVRHAFWGFVPLGPCWFLLLFAMDLLYFVLFAVERTDLVGGPVASFLRLRSSEPLSFAYRGVPPPPALLPQLPPMSTVAPDSSILRSQGASEREKVSSRGLFLASSRFETLLRRFFFFSRPRRSASRSNRLERERCSTFLLSALDRTKNASQNGSKKLPKFSRNLP